METKAKYELTSEEAWGGCNITHPVLIEGMGLEEAKRRVDEAWGDGWIPLSWWEYKVNDGAWKKEMCWVKDRTKRIVLVLKEVA